MDSSTVCLDVSKVRDEFGFTAKMGFEEGLKKMIGWYGGALSLKK
jgi:nucleoside-diphosphate-sugar epimerase